MPKGLKYKTIFESNPQKVYLLYGELADCFSSSNLEPPYDICFYLSNILKDQGFERVVFYSGAGNRGKFLVDDDMARAAVSQKPINRAEPHCMPMEDLEKRLANLGSVTFKKETQAKTANEKTFSKVRMKNSGMDDFAFVQECDEFFKSEIKTAVVFYDGWDLFNIFSADPSRSPSARRLIEMVSVLWKEYSDNENICVILAPNLTCHNINEYFSRNWSSLFVDGAGDDAKLNKYCYNIGLPEEDEIEYMLQWLSQQPNNKIIKLPFGEEKIKEVVNRLVFCSRTKGNLNGESENLSSIKFRLEQYHSENSPDQPVYLDVEKVSEIYGVYEEKAKKPIDKLKNNNLPKPGWEKPYERLSKFVKECQYLASQNQKNDEFEYVKDWKHKTKRIASCSDKIGGGLTNSLIQIPNFVLTGNPGVGKSTIARIIGEILKDSGILSIGHTVNVTKSDLVSGYLGMTGPQTLQWIDRANGGVLFIDEAHSLAEKDSGSNQDPTGKTVCSTLVSAMTNPNYRFCVVLAGYTDGINDLFNMDPGLRSRFSEDNFINIDDYKGDVLKSIFIDQIKEAGFNIDEQLTQADADIGGMCPLDVFFNNMYRTRNRKTFGNARDAKSLAEYVKQSARCRDNGFLDMNTIYKDDFGEKRKAWFVQKNNENWGQIENKLKNEFVGLEHVRDKLYGLKLETEYYQYQKEKQKNDRNSDPIEVPPPRNLIFAGNPGTGKTTVARLVCDLYCTLGVLSSNDIVEKNASELMSGDDFLINIQEAVQEARNRGTVLFIDEAHQFCEFDEGHKNTVGKMAIDALMSPMTEEKREFVVIFGLYEHMLENFMKVNPGMKSRVDVIHFDDFDGENLFNIFDKKAKKQKLTYTNETEKRLRALFESLSRGRMPDFGNGREVERIINEMNKNRLRRLKKEFSSDKSSNDESEFTDIEFEDQNEEDDLYCFKAVDIPRSFDKIIERELEDKSFKTILEDIQKFGWKNAYDVLNGKQSALMAKERFPQRKYSVYPGHYFFVGNPGTGKTTCASFFAKALYDINLIPTDHFLAVTAKDLVGQYLGHSAPKTAELLQNARKGVLFIDEAYDLVSNNWSGDTYKKEALDQLIACMDNEEFRKDTCVILAGYKSDLSQLYDNNAGMKSRITEIEFLDFSNEKLAEIFCEFCQKGGLSVADDVKNYYKGQFDHLREISGKTFSNARLARQIAERTIDKQSKRILENDISDEEMANTITNADVLNAEELENFVHNGRNQ